MGPKSPWPHLEHSWPRMNVRATDSILHALHGSSVVATTFFVQFWPYGSMQIPYARPKVTCCSRGQHCWPYVQSLILPKMYAGSLILLILAKIPLLWMSGESGFPSNISTTTLGIIPIVLVSGVLPTASASTSFSSFGGCVTCCKEVSLSVTLLFSPYLPSHCYSRKGRISVRYPALPEGLHSPASRDGLCYSASWGGLLLILALRQVRPSHY